MRDRLHWAFGARAFLRKHGAPAVLDALHDGVLLWDEMTGHWVVNPRLRNPAAFLNKLLNAP